MSLEKLANSAQTTLNGAVNNSVTSVVVASASLFPSAGNFRVLVDSELMLVTAVAGTTFTVTRGVEGTTAASHSSGATLTHVLTAASLPKVVGEFNLFDTYANIPAAGVAGRVFTPSDFEGVRYYDTGSAWYILTASGQIVAPPSSSLLATWVNQQDATFSQVQGFMRFTDPGGTASGEDVRLILKSTAAATSVQLDVLIGNIKCRQGSAVIVFGAAFRKSGTGAIKGIGYIFRANVSAKLFAARWSDPNTFAATAGEAFLDYFQQPFWLRASFTYATNTFRFWMSLDGTNYSDIGSYSDSNLSSLDQLGLLLNNFDGSVAGIGASFDVLALTTTEV